MDWLEGGTGVPDGRVFFGRVPADVVEVRLSGLRADSRAEARPLGVWAAHLPGRRHFRRIDFLNAAGEVVRSLDYVDGTHFLFGRVGSWCRGRWGAFRRGGPPSSATDLIPDWESRLTA